MACIPRAQGKWEESAKILREGIADDEQEPGDYKFFGPMGKLYPLAMVNAPVTWEEGLAHTRSAIDLYHRFDPSSSWLVMYGAFEVFWQLKGGQITAAEADSAFARLRLKAESESPQVLPAVVWLEGYNAAEQGRHQDAIALFQEAVAATKPWVWYYPLPESYLEVGRIEEAVKLAERLLGWYDGGRATFVWSVKIHYLAGKIYQADGQTDRAIEQFETFLMIWKDADPIFPEIDDAKQRLESLKSPSPK